MPLNGQGPKPVHQVVFTFFDNSEVQCATSADEIMTMGIIGKGMDALASAFAEKKQQQIIAPPIDLSAAKLR